MNLRLLIYEVELIKNKYDSNHGIIQKCKRSKIYGIEGFLSGGGGHELYVSHYEFKIEKKIIEKAPPFVSLPSLS